MRSGASPASHAAWRLRSTAGHQPATTPRPVYRSALACPAWLFSHLGEAPVQVQQGGWHAYSVGQRGCPRGPPVRHGDGGPRPWRGWRLPCGAVRRCATVHLTSYLYQPASKRSTAWDEIRLIPHWSNGCLGQVSAAYTRVVTPRGLIQSGRRWATLCHAAAPPLATPTIRPAPLLRKIRKASANPYPLQKKRHFPKKTAIT